MKFTCLGLPVPQGSHRPMVSRTTGRTFVKQTARLHAWRQMVSEAAMRAMGRREAFEGALVVCVTFFFQRPKSLPKRVSHHTRRPDIDKLARGLLDSIANGIVMGDDAQVVELRARKVYGAPARVEVEVVEV